MAGSSVDTGEAVFDAPFDFEALLFSGEVAFTSETSIATVWESSACSIVLSWSGSGTGLPLSEGVSIANGC